FRRAAGRPSRRAGSWPGAGGSAAAPGLAAVPFGIVLRLIAGEADLPTPPIGLPRTVGQRCTFPPACRQGPFGLRHSRALPRRAGDHGIGFANGATFVAGSLEDLVGDLGPLPL